MNGQAVLENLKNEYYLEKSFFIEEIEGLQLWRLGLDSRDEFNRFIFKVYSEAFGTDGILPFSFEDIETQSALYYSKTKVCGIRHPDGTLLGTWGLVLKNVEKDRFLLPIEANYSLSSAEIIRIMGEKNIQYIFNGWRTAIDKEAMERLNLPRQKSIFIFDFLLRGLTKDFTGSSDTYLGVSEMEKLVYKYHRRVGIPWVILAEPKEYWGRDRYPCAFRMGEFQDYLKKNHPERFVFLTGRS
ncbi:MAG TPA: hypothetical protein PL048_19290 [Leptospiraceae bacterium]|nr:hypothetical protein [Leptospiraceae bacterium]HMY67967.1 hypothetical protein [Leptospiraceae bacterium]HMZ60930.1 hypothetical protein [Leptospiraceae bacterium]HNF14892.1 hypothetical protein [Leptospiraceae bacterium]HNF26116.1 hypothetical protein [Leptospiraceae bacterium]